MIKNLILALLLISTCSDAKITLNDLSAKPTSRAKDFMIWQYLKQNITPSQANKAFSQANNSKSSKLFSAYVKKTKNKDIRYKINCRKKTNLLKIKDTKCLELAFTPYKALKLTKKQRNKLSKKLDSKSKKELLKILNEKRSIEAYRKYDSDTILTLFASTGKTYRQKYLNIYLDKDFLDSLTSSWRMTYFINTVVYNNKLDNLQLSLLDINGEKLNSKTNFLLALNALKHADIDAAERYFIYSRVKSKYKINVDKNNFWLYKVTHKNKYLHALLLSMDINMYTLYQREKMSIDFENYFITLETTKEKHSKKLSNPFDWDIIRQEIKNTDKKELFKLAKFYKQEEMLPVQAMIIQKAYGHNKHAYLMPYDKYLDGLNLDTKALIYAIMRQESSMIPSALSRSYALGLMQIMPFVTDDLSKRMKNPIKNYNDMFLPEYNIKYSRAHIKWMHKSLYHPLFMAYAYNGGMGFFKKYLMKGNFSSGQYEPFLSMEMMSNSESREYGKKVLANYVMYKKVMGDEVSIVQLFDTLTQPKKTDRFRARG